MIATGGHDCHRWQSEGEVIDLFRRIKKKTARRWLNRNSWNIAQLKIGNFVGHQTRFVKQYLKCVKEVKRNG